MANKCTVAIACVAAVLALGTAACSAPQQAAERILENQLGPGAEIDIDEDGGIRGSVENEDGSYEIGTGKLPADWPQDIPAPSGFTTTQAFVEKDVGSAIATFVAEGQQMPSAKAYLELLEAQGWVPDPEAVNAPSGLWFATKGERTLSVGIQVSSETYITVVSN
jgi:hypothetical protein